MWYPRTIFGRWVDYFLKIVFLLLAAILVVWMGKPILGIMIWFVFKQTILGSVFALLSTVLLTLGIIVFLVRITRHTVKWYVKFFPGDVFVKSFIFGLIFLFLLELSVLEFSFLSCILVKIL